MYFPYLREKQEELLSVRDGGFLSDLTIPIFEPITLSDTNQTRMEHAIQNGRRFAIIVNSAHGKPQPPRPNEAAHVVHALPPDRVLPALEIRPGTRIAQIAWFVGEFLDRRCLVVHRNHQYTSTELIQQLEPLGESVIHVTIDGGVPEEVVRQLPAQARVLLRGGFKHQPTNADYQEQSHFDDLLYTFQNRGFDGFGDFTTVRDQFQAGGGAAHTIALHLTEVAGGRILANHFISHPPHIRGNNRRKYLEAVERLVEYVSERPGFDTVGVAGFRDSWETRSNPGFGKPKRWSIQHHFEIIERELSRRGETPIM